MISSQDLCNSQINPKEEFKLQTISLIAHENMCTRLSKIIKNLICIIIILIGIIGAIVAGILYTVNQYDLEQKKDEQVSVNGEIGENNSGKNVILGGNYYGEGNDSKEKGNN